jgi:hypothetical protein
MLASIGEFESLTDHSHDAGAAKCGVTARDRIGAHPKRLTPGTQLGPYTIDTLISLLDPVALGAATGILAISSRLPSIIPPRRAANVLPMTAPETTNRTVLGAFVRLIDSRSQPVVFLASCDAHPHVAVVDCADQSPPRAPSRDVASVTPTRFAGAITDGGDGLFF